MARDKISSGPKTVTIPSSVATDKGDRIFLHGLAVECIIGFIEWERRIKQTIVLDVEMPVDCARAAQSDDVADTLDYKKVAKRLIAFVSESEFKLVETLAHRAAMMILEEFGVEWVRLSVNKPGAIRHSKDVGVAVLRTRADLDAAMTIAQARPRARVRRGRQQRRAGEESRARLRRDCAHLAGCDFLARLSQRGGGLRRAGLHQPGGGILRRAAAGVGDRAPARHRDQLRPAALRAQVGVAHHGPRRAAVRRSRREDQRIHACRGRTCSSVPTCWGRWRKSRRRSCIPPSSEPSASCGRPSMATGTR